MTKYFYMYRGLPGSGKSTRALLLMQQIRARGEQVYQLNRDDLRVALFGACREPIYVYSKAAEQAVTNAEYALAGLAASEGAHLLSSNTNLNPKVFSGWRSWAEKHGYTLVEDDSFMHVPVQTCIERQALRPENYVVPAEVILQMYERYKDQFPEQPDLDRTKYSLQTNHFRKYEQDWSMPSAVIFDLDGTLADMTGVRGPFDYSKCHLDAVHHNVRNLLLDFDALDYFVIILSGREGTDECRRLTESWLSQHDVPHSMLLMRPAGDTRKDSIVKEELFFQHVAPRFNVHAVFDDRNQVVQMWRSIGLTCCQVAEGNF